MNVCVIDMEESRVPCAIGTETLKRLYSREHLHDTWLRSTNQYYLIASGPHYYGNSCLVRGDKYIPCKKGINRKLWHSIKAQQIV